MRLSGTGGTSVSDDGLNAVAYITAGVVGVAVIGADIAPASVAPVGAKRKRK